MEPCQYIGNSMNRSSQVYTHEYWPYDSMLGVYVLAASRKDDATLDEPPISPFLETHIQHRQVAK